MKILITGGAGFIGANLTRNLLAAGHEITVLDNMATGRASNLEAHPNLKIIEGDVRELPDLQAERIYNLACPASPPQYQKDPVGTFTTSVIGALKVLELAAKSGARVLQASTSEVYGDPEISPQKENYWGRVNPVGLRSCYDEGKRAAETLCSDFGRTRGADVRIIRIFNTYGPFMDPADGRVVSNFIVQALRNEPLTIYGDGSQTRSFQYVDDLISGMNAMMENTRGFKGPVNIGNPVEFTVKQLAEKILSLIPESKSELVYRPLPADDPRQRRPDTALAKTELGWEPRTPLEEGLPKTIAYFRSVLGLQ